MPDAIAQFANAKYLNLETFRKSGLGVRTPVWFAQEPGRPVLYVYSEADAGKIKRVRNNSKVRIAPCNFRGNLKGAWVEAQARICDADEARHGQLLLRDKYGLLKKLGDLFGGMLGHENAVLAIDLV
jgi:uncharacterized protein